MLDKKPRAVIVIITGLLAVPFCVCLYGFIIGGEWLSFKYIAYCLVTSFALTSFAFLFIFGKENFRKMLTAKPFVIALLVVFAVGLLLYQPLNILSATGESLEYETDIIWSHRANTVYFYDSEGIERHKDVSLRYMVTDDDVLWPETGGSMIVRETMGGFHLKFFEIVEVTYEPGG